MAVSVRRGPPEGAFRDGEAAPELTRMGERLKLAQQGGLRPSFLFEQPVAGELREPGALRDEWFAVAAKRGHRLRQSGEIDMGRDVLHPGCCERVFPGPVAVVGAECSTLARGVIEILTQKTVVEPQHEPPVQALGQRSQEFPEAHPDLGFVTIRERGPEMAHGRCQRGVPDFAP